MKNLKAIEIWYITGSQHLYGEETLKQVAAHSQKIVEELNGSQRLPIKLVIKSTLTRPEEIRALCLEANNAPNCAGLILWMHTFSPSKMWIGGLSALRKPFLHLHTQFNRDLPWSEIDMDFMNLNQSAHGSLAGCQHHQTQDTFAIDLFAILFDPNVRSVLVSYPDEHGCRTRMQAQLILNDREGYSFRRNRTKRSRRTRRRLT